MAVGRRGGRILESSAGDAETEDLIEVGVDSIRVHVQSGQHVVILKEKDADRYVPIWIGPYEANAIALRITGQTPERPITHDLMMAALDEYGVRVRRVVVASLTDAIYHARVHLEQDGREVEIDSRASDAIAMAVRAQCPILVSREVADSAGVVPDRDSEDETESTADDDDRLEVFRNLVNSLDLPDLPDEPRGSQS